ncbi:MAG: hypothetical protein LUH03_10010 [Oscillospiraceae bacterium]|nr:hypothetical protein [Oscillospiraceae bacterium]
MTSEERRELRYQRRKAERERKKQKACAGCDTFEQVFSYAHLYHSYRMCRRTVGWKASTQKYVAQAPLLVYDTRKQLLSGRFRSPGFYEFDVRERGKQRHIKSVTMKERVVQRCLCGYALVPVLGRTFVYDNGASMQNKGYSFAVRRMRCHLQRHFRKHGTDGYILLFDFRHFFDNVSHRVCKDILRTQFTDQRIIRLTERFIDAFGDVGLGLGSQISQVFALASANRLDHVLSSSPGIESYGRYMDDGYLIANRKEDLQRALEVMRQTCAELEITLNERKTRIQRVDSFTWLKVRWHLTDTGYVVKRIYKRSVTVMRRKLKSFRRLVDEGKMTLEDVYISFQAWQAYALQFDAYWTLKSLRKLYTELFVFPTAA